MLPTPQRIDRTRRSTNFHLPMHSRRNLGASVPLFDFGISTILCDKIGLHVDIVSMQRVSETGIVYIDKFKKQARDSLLGEKHAKI